jgi:large repetitive protein
LRPLSVLRSFFVVLAIFSGSSVFAQVDITTWQGSLQHTGLNSNETVLTPGVVGSPGNFGLLFTQQTDGQTYGQPLYMSSQTLAGLPGAFPDGKKHNVVYIATQSGSLYAFDADADPQGANPNGTNSSPLWHTSLIPPGDTPLVQTDVASSDILGNLSVTTTPVIDPVSGTIYIVSAVKNPSLTPPFQQFLHALDLKTGLEKTGSPVLINPTFTGTPTVSNNDTDPVTAPAGQIAFSPLHEHLREAMVLYNGIIYLSYASHSDQTPYYGEILGYDASTLSLVKTFITTPNGQGGAAGLWQSGAGPAIDAFGNMYLITGNGPFDQIGQQNDWGESVLKLPTNSPAAQMPLPFSDTTSWFTPNNWSQLNSGTSAGLAPDRDLGSGGMLLLPDQTQGSHTHLMVGGGKAGVLYVLDRDSLGGLTANDTTAVQEIVEPSGTSLFVTPAYFNGNIYYAPAGGHLEQRQVQYDPTFEPPHYLSSTAITSTVNAPFKGAGVFISSNGNSNGIVWTLGNALTAYDATNVTNPIFNTNTNVPGIGGQCQTAKFTLPIEANSKVYYTCFNANTNIGYLFVSGLFPVAVGTPPAPSNLTAVANSASQITTSWTNNSTSQTGFTFTINRATNPTGPFSLAGSVSAGTTTFTDIERNPGTTYYYQVLATNGNGSSNATNVASATTFPAFASPGLVAYWNMDDGSSANVFDVTGNGNQGTSMGEAAGTSLGYINGGWIFHGTSANDRIVVPNNPALQFAANQSFTLSAWLNPVSLTGKEQALIVKSADQGNQYGIFINSANQWTVRGPGGDLVGPTPNINTWTNIALVQDATAGTRSLYVNGVLQASRPAQAADGAGDLWMGEQNVTGSAEGYEGRIDEVRIYNTALTPSSITTTLAPAILEAVSTQTHGSAGTFPLTLFPASTIQTEPRIGSVAGTYNLMLHFAAPVTGVTASLTVQPGITQSAVGNIASITFDSTNTIATVALTGVQNSQALDLHLAGVLPASVPGGGVATIPGTADIPFNILQGDVTGDHVVNAADYTAVSKNLTAALTQTTAPYDLNGDGLVNTADQNLVAGLAGSTLNVQTDANLAQYKQAVALSVNGGNVEALAFDNDPVNTRWESTQLGAPTPNEDDQQWIYVDLGATATIHTINLRWENAAGQNYDLQVSNDQLTAQSPIPTNWATIKSVIGNTNGGLKTYSGFNVTGRFVRMLGHTRTTTFGYSLFDFQVIGSFVPASSAATPVISSPATATGTVGVAFPAYQVTASQNPTSFGTSALPAGLTVSPAGLITGTPQTAGQSTVTISATNSTGTGTAQLTITINPPAPQPPANLTAAAGSGQVSLSWSASTGATTYSVFRGTSSGGESTTALVANLTGTSFTDTTVTIGTTYFYVVKAVNSTGASNSSNETSATPGPTVVIPSAPTGLSAAVGNSQITLTWNASTGATSYNVFRGTTTGGESAAAIAQNLTALTFTDTTVTNGTTYFYKVSASNSAGVSAQSNEASATPVAPQAGVAIYQLDAGSTASVPPFTADQFVSGGTTSATNATVATAGVSNAAPMKVYQTNRYGTFTYTIPSLTAGASYTVRLHFAENFWTAANKRVFSVTINNQVVLSAFDIFAAAGGENIAVVQSFPVTANSSGQIVIAFTSGTGGKDNPQVNGIEVLTSGGSLPLPAAPVALFPTPGKSQVSLSWSPGMGPTGTYNVFRGTASGAESTTPIATGLAGTHFIDTTVTNLTTYYYVVEANNSTGASASSNEVSAVPDAPVAGSPVYQIAAGSTTANSSIAPFALDADFTGGNNSGTGNTIDTTAVVSPAPMAVYQHERSGGNFSYVFPNLTPGANYTVRLHFAEFFWTAAGQRVFNVSINGLTVLPSFDIVATAGAANKALVEQFTATADSTGSITINYSPGSADQPKASAIEIYH